MSTFMYAFAESFDGKAWRLTEPLRYDEDWADEVPTNAWPGWGRANSLWYCEASGLRGLPDGMDPRLVRYIEKHWSDKRFADEAVAASWLGLAEMRALQQREPERSHFAVRHFSASDPSLVETRPCRMVFWVDQT